MFYVKDHFKGNTVFSSKNELDCLQYLKKQTQAGRQFEYSILCDISELQELEKVIDEIQNKLSRRNMQIRELKQNYNRLLNTCSTNELRQKLNIKI